MPRMPEARPRKLLRKLLLALLAPLLFLLLLEGVFALMGVEVPRFSGLGDQDTYWMPWQEPGKPEGYHRAFVRKYKQHLEELPIFLKEKPANGWRVFVLGESTVQGFPYETGCFADWMRLRARAMLPDRTVEVVNAGQAGWAARDLHELLRECLEHEPDAIVWMVGHNEYHPGNVLALRHEVEHPVAHALKDVATSLRTVEWLGRQFPALHHRRADAFEERQSDELPCFGIEHDLLKQRFAEHTAGVVADAREAGVPIVLCTMARNIREWPPNYSFFSPETHRDDALRARWDEAYLAGLQKLDAGDAAGAVPLFDAALVLDAAPGKAHFARARALQALGRDADAVAAYRQALEQDGGPNRAHAWEELVIRDVAARTGTPLVDIEAIFDDRAEALHLAGGELITDNVHPSLEGHEVMASAILDVLERELHVPFDRKADVGREEGRERLGITEHVDENAQKNECLNLTRLALQSGAVHNAWKKAFDLCIAVLSKDPTEYEVMGCLGLLEALAGRTEKARTLIQKAMDNNPYVKTSYVLYWKSQPPYQRAFEAAGVDMAAVEASLSDLQKQQVDNRLFRARTR
jgi:tetratricopeptide (TPR) repeat protein